MEGNVREKIAQIRDEGMTHFISIEEERAIEQGKGYISAVYAAVDDNILTDSLSSAGSRMLDNFKPPYCATVVSRLRDKGYVILGKTMVPEFGIAEKGEYSLYGGPKAVAAGYCDVSLSSDSLGMMGAAASEAGVYYIKPTYGTVSRYGLVAYASSMDQIGVASRSVNKAFETLSIISGYDKNDGVTYPTKQYEYESGEEGVRGLKVALVDNPVGKMDKFIDKFRTDGGICETVEFRFNETLEAVAYIIAAAEGSNNLSRFDGVKFGCRAKEHKGIDDLYVKTRTEGFGTDAKITILMGAYVLSRDNYERYYMKAMKVRRLISEAVHKLLNSFDCILLPAGTPLANLTGDPALSMPEGVQLITGAFNENILLRLGRWMEKSMERGEI